MASLAFDTEVAAKVGVNAAVIYSNLLFWCRKNACNERDRAEKPHFKEGKWWTYSSAKAMAETFGYLSEREVRYALAKLKSEGMLIVGSFNRSKYDRTLWFSIVDDETVSQNRNSDVTNSSHQSDGSVAPIPDITADVTKDITADFDSFYEAYPKKVAPSEARRAWKKVRPPLEGCLESIRARIASGSWKVDEKRFIPNPATFINQRRWEDEVESGGTITEVKDKILWE